MQDSRLETMRADTAPKQPLLVRLGFVDRVSLAFVSGSILGLSSPGLDLSWLAWCGLAPLMVLSLGSRGKTEALATGLTFGFGYSLVSLHWLLGLYPLSWMGLPDFLGFQVAVFAWLVESLHQATLMAVFALFICALPMRAGFLPYLERPYFPFLLTCPFIWIFLQWVVHPADLFFGLPVNQLAYSQFGFLPLIQLARLGGSQLLDLLIVLLNACLALAFVEATGAAPALGDRLDRLSPRSGAIVDLGVAAAFVLVAIAWGSWNLHKLEGQTALVAMQDIRQAALEPPVPVALVQGNLRLEEERSGAVSSGEITQRYLRLCKGRGALLICLPEGVITPGQEAPGLLFERLRQLCRREKKELATGAVRELDSGYVNSVLLISPDQQRQDRMYIQRRMTWLTEFLPLAGEPKRPPAPQVPGGRRHGFLSTSQPLLLASMWGKIGASLGFELIYPRLLAEQARRGAALLVGAANFACFHNSVLSRQILASAVLRAVENGRYLVLVTNTGISAVIDPAGFVSSRSVPNKKGLLVDTVKFLYRKTPATKMWWL